MRDDGRGFNPDAALPQADLHVALRIMRERAQQLGGELRVQSAPGQGTVVTLTLAPSGALATPHAERQAA